MSLFTFRWYLTESLATFNGGDVKPTQPSAAVNSAVTPRDGGNAALDPNGAYLGAGAPPFEQNYGDPVGEIHALFGYDPGVGGDTTFTFNNPDPDPHPAGNFDGYYAGRIFITPPFSNDYVGLTLHQLYMRLTAQIDGGPFTVRHSVYAYLFRPSNGQVVTRLSMPVGNDGGDLHNAIPSVLVNGTPVVDLFVLSRSYAADQSPIPTIDTDTGPGGGNRASESGALLAIQHGDRVVLEVHAILSGTSIAQDGITPQDFIQYWRQNNVNSFLELTFQGTATWTWQNTGQVLNEGLSNFGSAYVDGKIYVAGGVNHAITAARHYEYASVGIGESSAWTQSADWTMASASEITVQLHYRQQFFYFIWDQTAQVYYAARNADGTINSTFTLTTSYPLDNGVVYTTGGATVVCGAYIYRTGGVRSGVYSGKTAFAPINNDGSIGAWTFTGSLPVGEERQGHSLVQMDGFLYVVGGVSGAGVKRNILRGTIAGDGTVSWDIAGAVPTAFNGSQGASSAVIMHNTLYLIDLYSASTSLRTLFACPLNADTGTMGAWDTVAVAGPDQISTAQLLANPDLSTLYLVAGYSSSTGNPGNEVLFIDLEGYPNTAVDPASSRSALDNLVGQGSPDSGLGGTRGLSVGRSGRGRAFLRR